MNYYYVMKDCGLRAHQSAVKVVLTVVLALQFLVCTHTHTCRREVEQTEVDFGFKCVCLSACASEGDL